MHFTEIVICRCLTLVICVFSPHLVHCDLTGCTENTTQTHLFLISFFVKFITFTQFYAQCCRITVAPISYSLFISFFFKLKIVKGEQKCCHEVAALVETTLLSLFKNSYPTFPNDYSLCSIPRARRGKSGKIIGRVWVETEGVMLPKQLAGQSKDGWEG